ncbi:uridine phosphorylase [Candidatus Falkowbacteria bacterium CG10_big_fil_rev_8_21_14_0_10_39_9]|uniref:Uridine phosphorylase n=1 Tax=Candidatus Falkowbacteria bacterium CG10_big_fil_rev_8_21_14_0_10_39_9 TaxID=1974566 RepID=A0A2M6WPV9_9BACT|nr:MAG: uridine phosphorylase [Candidatus Falkowbacteria bacterium CG10_big_fil_rev_8_21_14_0_10_39_9]
MISKLEPHLLCKKGDIAPYVLLPGDPGRVLRMAKLLDNPKEISFNREYRIVTGKYQGLPVTICSTGIGGPSTAIAIEELINLGAHTFIRVGSCGACQKKIKIGEVVISDSVIREDHTCLDYVPLQFPAVANRHVLRALEEIALKTKSEYYVGPTISSDALYSQANRNRKIFWSKFGALAQDMEAGTVLTLARVKGVRAGSILLVVAAEGEKNIKAKIARYSSEAQSGQGQLVEKEKRAVQIALEALLILKKK